MSYFKQVQSSVAGAKTQRGANSKVYEPWQNAAQTRQVADQPEKKILKSIQQRKWNTHRKG
ncbi:MAG: hypothetical protein BGO21_20930 [Dyadobacter sp. 50-39]|nr:MAG: hypothetical protein BGO21_20930 [Dyadobacter sp. 50-39]